jgi:hypothetical protein
LQAFALSCEDTADDCAGLDCGVFAAINELRLVANKSDIITTRT